jgi:hypothetical protein
VWLGGFVSAAVILMLLGRIALRLLQDAEHERVMPAVPAQIEDRKSLALSEY